MKTNRFRHKESVMQTIFGSVTDHLTKGLSRRLSTIFTEFMQIAQQSGLSWEEAHSLYKHILAEEVRATLAEEGINIPV
jgi:hypothetical protein